MIENPYKRLPPLERKPDGTPYRMTPAQRKQANALIPRRNRLRLKYRERPQKWSRPKSLMWAAALLRPQR